MSACKKIATIKISLLLIGFLTVLIPVYAQQQGLASENYAKSFMLIVDKSRAYTDPLQKRIVDVSKPDQTLVVPSRLDAFGLSVDASENLYINYKTDYTYSSDDFDYKVTTNGSPAHNQNILYGVPIIDLTDNQVFTSIGSIGGIGVAANIVTSGTLDPFEVLLQLSAEGTSFNLIYSCQVGKLFLPSGQVDVSDYNAAFDWGKGVCNYTCGAENQNMMLINPFEKACFAIVDCDPEASWHAWDSDEHSYSTHTAHLAEHPSFSATGGADGPPCGICYPHTYQASSMADDSGMDGGSTYGASAGGQTEPYGQQVGSAPWHQPTAVPNGAWWHSKHSTTAGRDNYAVVRRRQYWPIFLNVLLEKHEKQPSEDSTLPPEYIKEPLPGAQVDGAILFKQYGFNACEWTYPQCADSCYDVNGGNPEFTPSVARNPYQIVVGPSGRVYKYAAYRPATDTVIQFLDPVNGSGWENIPELMSKEWIIDVDCDLDFDNKINSIGCATKSLTEDWLYLSSSKNFAVGDQFDGQGGICYLKSNDPTTGVGQVRKIDFEGNSRTDLGLVDLGPNIDVSTVDAIAADGMGQLYFTTKNAGGANNPWQITDTQAFDSLEISNFNTNSNGQFDTDVALKRAASIDLHHVDLRTQQPQKDQAVASGFIMSTGTVTCSKVKDPVNDPSIVNSQNIVDIQAASTSGNVNMSQIHVALATVVGATPPVNGRNQIDIIGPTDNMLAPHSTAQNVDVITVEDLSENGGVSAGLVWEAENWKTEYSFSAPMANDAVHGGPVDIMNSSNNDILYKSSPYMTSGNAHLNAYHYNWWNFDDLSWTSYGDPDTNGNGYIGGWSSHVLGDGLSNGQAPGSASTEGPWKSTSGACPKHDTRAWRWAVYMTHAPAITSDISTPQANAPDQDMVKLETPLLIYGYDIMGYMSNTPETESKGSADGWYSARLKGYELRLGDNRYQDGSNSVGGPFKMRGAGIYEVMCQAKVLVYNYKASKIGPEFMKDPNQYVPERSDYIGMADYPEFDVGGGVIMNNYGNYDDGQSDLDKYMTILAKASSDAHGDSKMFPEGTNQKQGWVVAKRRVYVGAKTPDAGAWANLVLFARNPHSTSDSSFKTGPFNPDPENDKTDTVAIEADEDEVIEFQSVAAVKYTMNIDEWVAAASSSETVWDALSFLTADGAAPDYTGARTKKDTQTSGVDLTNDIAETEKIDYDDAAAKMHDLFSGVLPGTVVFEWNYFNEDGAKVITTTGKAGSLWDNISNMKPDSAPSSAQTGQTYADDTPDCINPVEILIRKDWDGSKSTISQNDLKYLQTYSDSAPIEFEFNVSEPSGNMVKTGNQLRALENALNTTASNLSWSAGAGSWQKYVPNGSPVALFYFTSLEDVVNPGLVPNKPAAQNTSVPDAQKYYGLRHFHIYKTPSIGKPSRQAGDALYGTGSSSSYGNLVNCYRVKVTMRGTIREYDPSNPAVLQSALDDVNADPLSAPTGGANALESLAQAFTYTDHADQVLVERYINVIVHDRTAPVVVLDIPNNGTDGSSGATTGDYFSNPIVVTLTDNNPYMSPGLTTGAADFGRLWENGVESRPDGSDIINKKGSGKFDARLAYHYSKAGSGIQPPAADAGFFWADIPMVEEGTNSDTYCDIKEWLAGTASDYNDPTDPQPKLVDPANPLDSCSTVTYTMPSDRWQMNADAYAPEHCEADITVFVSAVDGCGNGAMVMLNPPEAEKPLPAILNGDKAGQTFRGNNQSGDGNITADVGVTQSVGIDSLPAEPDEALLTEGISFASKVIKLKDNDAPELQVDMNTYGSEGGSFSHIMAYSNWIPAGETTAPARPVLNNKSCVYPWVMDGSALAAQGRPEYITQTIRDMYPPNIVDKTDSAGKIDASMLNGDEPGKMFISIVYNGDTKKDGLVKDSYLQPLFILNPADESNDPDCDMIEENLDAVNLGWEVNLTKSDRVYFMDLLLPDIGPDQAPPFSVKSFIPIPEDTRCRFTFRAMDNVDGYVEQDDFNNDAKFQCITRYPPASNLQPDADLITLNIDEGSTSTPALGKLSGEPDDLLFGFFYHRREPTPSNVPSTEWIVTYKDNQGNIRAFIAPLRVTDTRVNIISLEQK